MIEEKRASWSSPFPLYPGVTRQPGWGSSWCSVYPIITAEAGTGALRGPVSPSGTYQVNLRDATPNEIKEHWTWVPNSGNVPLCTTFVTGNRLFCRKQFQTGEILIFFQLVNRELTNHEETALLKPLSNRIERRGFGGRKGTSYCMEFKSFLSSNTTRKWPGIAVEINWILKGKRWDQGLHRPSVFFFFFFNH